MMRTQPPGFRWMAGGAALVGACVFFASYWSGHDKGELIFGVVCLALAGYWLIFDREPGPDDNLDP